MKAIVQDTYGSTDVLEFRDIDKPEIGDDEVLVRVRAAGVNPADWAIMSGLPYIARPVYGLRKPKNGVRGTDVAGEVAAVGTSVTRFRPGDEVVLPAQPPASAVVARAAAVPRLEHGFDRVAELLQRLGRELDACLLAHDPL